MNKNKMNNLFIGGKKLTLIAMLAAMPLASVRAQESEDRTDNTITMSFDQMERENAENMLKILGFAIGFGGTWCLMKYINKKSVERKLKNFEKQK